MLKIRQIFLSFLQVFSEASVAAVLSVSEHGTVARVYVPSVLTPVRCRGTQQPVVDRRVDVLLIT